MAFAAVPFALRFFDGVVGCFLYLATVRLSERSFRTHGTSFFLSPFGFHPRDSASISKSGYQKYSLFRVGPSQYSVTGW